MKEIEQTRRKQGNSTKDLTRNADAILLVFLQAGKQTMKSEVGKKAGKQTMKSGRAEMEWISMANYCLQLLAAGTFITKKSQSIVHGNFQARFSRFAMPSQFKWLE
jgi:hypothetical protein